MQKFNDGGVTIPVGAMDKTYKYIVNKGKVIAQNIKTGKSFDITSNGKAIDNIMKYAKDSGLEKQVSNAMNFAERASSSAIKSAKQAGREAAMSMANIKAKALDSRSWYDKAKDVAGSTLDSVKKGYESVKESVSDALDIDESGVQVLTQYKMNQLLDPIRRLGTLSEEETSKKRESFKSEDNRVRVLNGVEIPEEELLSGKFKMYNTTRADIARGLTPLPINAAQMIHNQATNHSPMSNRSFTPGQIDALKSAVLNQYKKTGEKSGGLDYDSYSDKINNTIQNGDLSLWDILSTKDSEQMSTTIGGAIYKIDDMGNIYLTDRYDWNPNKDRFDPKKARGQGIFSAIYRGIRESLRDTERIIGTQDNGLNETAIFIPNVNNYAKMADGTELVRYDGNYRDRSGNQYTYNLKSKKFTKVK